MNESGAATPTKTNFYGSLTDPSGVTNKATRLVSTGNNQVFYFYRPSNCPAIPAGTYGLRFRARLLTGGTEFTLSFGLSSAYATKTVKDLDWSNSTNDADTTFEVEFAYSGTGDIAVRLPVTGNDFLIDRIQLYLGGLAAIPAWSAEVLKGARKAITFEDAFSLDANGNWDLTQNSGGGYILEPDLNDVAYTELTIMDVFALDDLDVAGGGTLAYSLAIPQSTRLGTVISTGPHIGVETNTTPYEGRAKWGPQVLRAETGLGILDAGLVIVGQALDASGRIAYFNEVVAKEDATAWAGVTANRWHIGSGSTATRAHIDAQEVVGKHALKVIWDRKIEPDEWAEKCAVIRAYFANHGGMGDIPDFHVLSGDSNWTSATGDWTQVISADQYFTPDRNLLFINPSVGGTGVAEVYGSSPYPAAMSASGRLLVTEAPALLAAAQAGRKAVYHLGWGTNDFTEIYGVANWGTAAYDATRGAVVEYLLNLHPNIYVLEYTILARGTGSGGNYDAAGRLTINGNIRTRQAADTTGRHFLCDAGGASSDLGDQTIADTGTYLVEAAPNGIHLINPTGDAVMAAFVKPVIESLRTSMGV
jgi:hypothetical protein